jgi:hypothetical protein
MKLYTFVVHYLQMCMKEYGCCPKCERGDNSTYREYNKTDHHDITEIFLKVPLNTKSLHI